MRLAKAPATFIARFCTFALGVSAILWAAIVFPKFWTEAAVFQAASRIIVGDLYSQEALATLVTGIEPAGRVPARPAALEPLAVVQLRLTEEAITRGEERDTKPRLASLDRTITTALTGSPNVPYQWLVLYWAESRLNGYNPQYLRYLRMSYDTGPLEGWVALRRNRIALALYAVLTDDLKEAALTEFIGLARSQLFADTADIFGNSTPIVRAALIARLDQLKVPDRQAFVKIIYDKGFWEAAVPGVNLVPSRPWR